VSHVINNKTKQVIKDTKHDIFDKYRDKITEIANVLDKELGLQTELLDLSPSELEEQLEIAREKFKTAIKSLQDIYGKDYLIWYANRTPSNILSAQLTPSSTIVRQRERIQDISSIKWFKFLEDTNRRNTFLYTNLKSAVITLQTLHKQSIILRNGKVKEGRK